MSATPSFKRKTRLARLSRVLKYFPMKRCRLFFCCEEPSVAPMSQAPGSSALTTPYRSSLNMEATSISSATPLLCSQYTSYGCGSPSTQAHQPTKTLPKSCLKTTNNGQRKTKMVSFDIETRFFQLESLLDTDLEEVETIHSSVTKPPIGPTAWPCFKAQDIETVTQLTKAMFNSQRLERESVTSGSLDFCIYTCLPNSLLFWICRDLISRHRNDTLFGSYVGAEREHANWGGAQVLVPKQLFEDFDTSMTQSLVQ